MPLLAVEPCIQPESLLDHPPIGTDGGSQFWVLHTRPRSEKALARVFLERGMSYFLPTYRREWRKNGRQFRSYLPLFPGYIFLHGSHDERSTALETNLVATVIPVRDQLQLHADLFRVHRLIQSGAPVTPEEMLEPGDPVSIVRGPLAGLDGIILQRGKNLKFVIEVRMLGRAVAAEVQNWMLEAVSG